MKTLNGRFRALLIGGAIGVSALAFGRGAWSADDSPPTTDTPAAGTPQTTPPAGMNDQPGQDDQGQPAGQNDSNANANPPSASRSLTTESSVTVTAIDRAARRATLKAPGGEKYTVSVPEDVRAFDTVKVGDKIDIDYYQSMALSILPPGTKPSMAQQTARIPGAEGGAIGKSLTVSARVVNVDTDAHEVTFKGPHGESRTVKVQDPDLQRKLSDLKQGDVVQLTYTEATAAAIRPAAEK